MMKCPRCGKKFDENETFCPNCGEEIHKQDKMNDIKMMVMDYWNQFDMIERMITVMIIAVVLLFLIAAICGKFVSCVFAILSLIFLVISLVMKLQVIKVSDQKTQWVMIALALILLFPFSITFKADKEESFQWNEAVSKEELPEPKSKTGSFSTNTKRYLSVDIDDTSAPDYYDYVDACKEAGYSIEAEEEDLSYDAYNEEGYRLSLSYDESDRQMRIILEKGMDLGELSWPESSLAEMIPEPDSKLGNIEEDTESRLSVYAGDVSLDAYAGYVNDCIGKGFTESIEQSERSFSARNTDGNKLTVDYQGNKIIHILLEEPQYTASIEIQCDENLIFSQYDVEIYVDDEYLGTVDHGSNESYSPVLKKGTHLIQFIDEEDSTVTGEVEIDLEQDEEYLFKIHCYSTSVNLKAMKGTLSEDEKEKQETEETEDEQENESADTPSPSATAEPTPSSTSEEEENITVENNEDFAKLLTVSDYDYYTEFAKKYEGKTIEFDASIDDFFANSKWNYDILLSAGDYSTTEVHGPSFKFDDVSRMQYKTDLSYLLAGINVHIIAEVDSFDENTGLFFLDAEVINGR